MFWAGRALNGPSRPVQVWADVRLIDSVPDAPVNDQVPETVSWLSGSVPSEMVAVITVVANSSPHTMSLTPTSAERTSETTGFTVSRGGAVVGGGGAGAGLVADGVGVARGVVVRFGRPDAEPDARGVAGAEAEAEGPAGAGLGEGRSPFGDAGGRSGSGMTPGLSAPPHRSGPLVTGTRVSSSVTAPALTLTSWAAAANCAGPALPTRWPATVTRSWAAVNSAEVPAVSASSRPAVRSNSADGPAGRPPADSRPMWTVEPPHRMV